MRFVLALTALFAVATTKASASAASVVKDDAAGRGEGVTEKDASFRRMRGMHKGKGKGNSSGGKGTSNSSKGKGSGPSKSRKGGTSKTSSKDSRSKSTAKKTPSSSISGNNNIPDARTCGLFCEIKSPNYPGLKQCLQDHFLGETMFRGEPNVPRAIFSEDDHYDFARHNGLGSRWPAAVVLAGNADGPTNDSTIEDVQKAVKCARDNGYKVSGRGKSHSYQRWGAMDGFVVIDMANSCAVLEVDKSQQGDHIIEGSKYIATAKFGAGCNNAFVVAALASFDDSEGAMALTGACPSVGVVGFALGGGQGDITPYVGQAADVVHEFEMIDHEGNLLTASETENEDLFWALRGGGGALGIIVSITYKVVESPLPPSSDPKDRMFTYAGFGTSDPEKAGELVYELQEFLTGAPKEISGKYGGGGSGSSGFFIYLGDQEQLREELTAYAPKFEKFVIRTYRIPRYQDIAMFRYCSYSIRQLAMVRPQLRNITFEGNEYQGIDICQELGIDTSSYCEHTQMGFYPTLVNCASPVVLDAMKTKALDPQSFLNNHGPHPTVATAYGFPPFPDNNGDLGSAKDIPGHILGRLSKETWDKILEQDPGYLWGNHFTHGATTLVGSKDTAYPHRDNDIWTLTEAQPASSPGFHVYLEEELNNDPSKLLGYYDYLGSERQPDWQNIYFGDNYKRLQKIKAKYDPAEMFTKPMTPETPYPESAKGAPDMLVQNAMKITIN